MRSRISKTTIFFFVWREMKPDLIFIRLIILSPLKKLIGSYVKTTELYF